MIFNPSHDLTEKSSHEIFYILPHLIDFFHVLDSYSIWRLHLFHHSSQFMHIFLPLLTNKRNLRFSKEASSSEEEKTLIHTLNFLSHRRRRRRERHNTKICNQKRGGRGRWLETTEWLEEKQKYFFCWRREWIKKRVKCMKQLRWSLTKFCHDLKANERQSTLKWGERE